MRYRVHGNAVKQTINFLGGCTTEATIAGLDASTNYFIEVAAVKLIGLVLESTIQQFMLQHKVPLNKEHTT